MWIRDGCRQCGCSDGADARYRQETSCDITFALPHEQVALDLSKLGMSV